MDVGEDARSGVEVRPCAWVTEASRADRRLVVAAGVGVAAVRNLWQIRVWRRPQLPSDLEC